LGVVHRVYVRLPGHHEGVEGEKQQQDDEEVPKGEGELLLVLASALVEVNPGFYIELLLKGVFPIFLILIVFAHAYGSL